MKSRIVLGLALAMLGCAAGAVETMYERIAHDLFESN